MTTTRELKRLAHLRLFAALAAAAIALTGLSIALGWLLNIPALQGALARGVNVKFNTAVGLIAAGLALLLLLDPPREAADRAAATRRAAGNALAAFIAALGAALLSQHVLGWDLGIDQLVVREPTNSPGSAGPGRVGPPASTSLMLCGLALLLLDHRPGRAAGPRSIPVFAGLALAVASLASLALIGYLYNADALFVLPRYTGIGAPTAAALLLLSTATLAARPLASPLQILARENAGGVLARRTLPAVVVAPVLLGWVLVRGQGLDLYDSAFGAAMLIIALVIVLVSLLWATSVELDRTEQRKAAIFEGALDGIVITDRRGVILEWNPAAEAMFGYTREEAVGRTVAETIIPPSQREAHAMGLSGFLAAPARGGSPPSAVVARRVELTAMRSGGEQFPVELAVSAVVPSGRGGGEVFFTSSIRDLSARRVADAARALTAAIVAGSDDAIISKTLGGVITTWNAAAERLFGYTAAEAVGRPITIIIPPERLSEEVTLLHRIETGERVKDFETVRRAKDGRVVLVSLTISPMKDASGRVIGASKVARDISARKAGEEALRGQHERLAMAFAAARMASWEYDPQTGAVVWSREMYPLLGLDEGFDGDRDAWFRERLHPEDAPGVRGAMEGHLRTGEPFEIEYRIRLDDGERWLATRGRRVPAPSAAGARVRVAGVTMDITPRRLAEEELRGRERLYTTLVENLPDVVFRLDRDLRHLYISPSVEASTGIEPDRFIGRTGLEAGLAAHLWPEFAATCREVLSTGTPRQIDFTHQTPHGPATFASRIIPEFGPGGTGEGGGGEAESLLGITADVTERRRTDEALRASEERFRLALSSGAVVVYEQDADLRYTWLYPRDTQLAAGPLGRTDAELLPGPQGAALTELKRMVLHTGIPARREVMVTTPYGDKWYDLVVETRRDEAGRIIGVGGAALDITDRRLIEDELRRHRNNLETIIAARTSELESINRRARATERLASLGTLAAGLGHDMANLLLPAWARLDTLDGMGLPGDARADLASIRSALGYLQRLSTGLRLMAADPEQRAASAAATDLGAWWADVEAVIRNVLPRGVSLAPDIAAGLGVAMPRHHLTQAVFNLVQNAGEAIAGAGVGRGGRVRVRATAARPDNGHAPSPDTEPPSTILVEVIDDGPGMTAEVAARCFEPYFSTKSRAISTGMGLSLVRGLAERAGGRVEVRSEPGMGTTFLLTLPAAGMAGADAAGGPGLKLIVSIRTTGDAGRTPALIATLLGTLGIKVSGAPASASGSAEPDDPDLWIISGTPAWPAVAGYLAERPGRCVLVCDEPPAAGSPFAAGERVMYIGKHPRSGELRRTLAQAAAGMAADCPRADASPTAESTSLHRPPPPSGPIGTARAVHTGASP